MRNLKKLLVRSKAFGAGSVRRAGKLFIEGFIYGFVVIMVLIFIGLVYWLDRVRFIVSCGG